MSRRVLRTPELDSDSNDEDIPMEIRVAADEAIENILPAKSRAYYRKVYIEYVDWKFVKNVVMSNGVILLAYFNHLSKNLALSTLWSKYSILKTMILKEENTNIGNHEKLKKFLEEKNVGFQAKKSLAFTENNLRAFFLHAPDHEFLAAKAVAATAISGACRRVEAHRITIDDVVDKGTYLVITLEKTQTHVDRTFTVNNPLREVIIKYMKLRPHDTAHRRLFLGYHNGKCTREPMGINKIGHIPQQIATWLGLPQPEKYSGHSFRRTSATWLINTGGTMEDLKRHRTWESSTVAESYIAESMQQKHKVNDRITSGLLDEENENSGSFAAYKRLRTHSDSESMPSTSGSHLTDRPKSHALNIAGHGSLNSSGPSINIQLNDCCLQ
ncbi:hypothetical protein QAD02_000511 [Eretmocerus hayati]|uniref:Uncharacterized protein n=1 Tax=Eretmocerus hayati TaxID=131215 RepID=A0ACC2NG83_9HYME|nr:hypothetical protein QAD02_000511 [Eretmocerus hayati]